MVWRIDDPQGDEAGKVKWDIVRYTRGKGIDLGCGPQKAFPHFIGVDSCKDTELFGIKMKPDVQCDDAADLSFLDPDSLDFIFSSHLLEHIEDHKAALASWWSRIKPGGHLVLYLPHRDLYPNIGTPGSNPDHKHDFCNDDISDAMCEVAENTGLELVVNETRSDGMEYSFLQVYRKRNDGVFQFSYLMPKPAKTVCVVRYGGMGDSIQAANILPELKRQGYHVTFMTTPRGKEPIELDPHVDDWFIQDTDQVPNGELAEFWKAQAKRFDRFINLSESVEGTLLTIPGRANHMWPDSLRRRLCDRNYLEFTAEIAEVPYTSEARFYPSTDEEREARAVLADIRAKLDGPLPIPMKSKPRHFIMWCLAGSSIHKFYPGQDDVVANVLAAMPEAVIIFVGDAACKILEAGWEQEPRVVCLSGEQGVRQTLALAQQVDLVIGPETGVLNAVAFEDIPKIVLLSHSSWTNLTLHWTNTTALEPENTPCYPCHRLHYGREFCHEDEETGAAICQKNIPPKEVFEVILDNYQGWKAFQGVIHDPQRTDQASPHPVG